MSDETVRDVCAELRAYDADDDLDVSLTKPELLEFVGRIEEAYEREMADKEAVHTQWRDNYHAKLAERDAEIARLMADLKPVMECEEKPLPCPFCGGKCETFVVFEPNTNCVVCDGCGYSSSKCRSEEDAIAAHNRVTKK